MVVSGTAEAGPKNTYIHDSQRVLIEFLDVTTKPEMIYFVLSETSVLIYIRPNLGETKRWFHNASHYLVLLILSVAMLWRLPSVTFSFPLPACCSDIPQATVSVDAMPEMK